jgi:hypothetical protein
MPVKSSGVLFERAAKKLGLHPFPAPVAILSQPYRGPRRLHELRVSASTFGCEMRAKSSTLVTCDSHGGKDRALRNPRQLLRTQD